MIQETIHEMSVATTVANQPTPHHLSPEEIRFFDENGYLILRNRIPQDLLSRLQEAGHGWIQQGEAYRDAPSDRWDVDYAFAKRGGRKTMFRVNYLHNKGYAASLELLGCPQVLGIAESLCGPNFVPTYESMVFKQEGDGAVIKWHQDAIHPRRHRIFNLDVYLDRSVRGAGALRVVPTSQREQQDLCAITEQYDWEVPGVVHAEMEPGDVLLHDVMVVHGSEPTSGNALRRTLYYEFRAAEEILEDGPWDQTWIDQRLRLLPLALRAHKRQYPGADQFSWNVSDTFQPLISNDDEVELKVAHLVHMDAAFCSAGDAGKQG